MTALQQTMKLKLGQAPPVIYTILCSALRTCLRVASATPPNPVLPAADFPPDCKPQMLTLLTAFCSSPPATHFPDQLLQSDSAHARLSAPQIRRLEARPSLFLEFLLSSLMVQSV